MVLLINSACKLVYANESCVNQTSSQVMIQPLLVVKNTLKLGEIRCKVKLVCVRTHLMYDT